MTDVKVVNNSGNEVTLRLPDTERGAELVEHLRKLARREELASVEVIGDTKPKRGGRTKADDAPAE